MSVKLISLRSKTEIHRIGTSFVDFDVIKILAFYQQTLFYRVHTTDGSVFNSVQSTSKNLFETFK